MGTRPFRRFAVLAAVFAVAGCTATTEGATPAPGVTTPPPSTAPTTTARPYATVTPVLELTDRTTKPGTKLKFGEQAVVPFYSQYDKGLLGLSVTVETKPAPDADIDQLPLKDEDKAKLRGKMFFFVHETLTNLDGANFTGVYAPILNVSTRSGGFPGTLLGMADHSVSGCEDLAFAPEEFAAKGATFEGCRLYFGTSSDPVTSLTYTQKPYDSASSKAVTWRK
ncbi:hypothetical protein FHX82_006727 [Amycolatopsis bartoniae]|uniref:hypothetical protein n=1 Tax=Amycolatopsis bartoniae TaxID=941986 RepID=UPI001606B679|nr:hypothetical protein [Amycolatopsis bartoniae]MBB2939641.1 hypothetical protein [Amycolatopsis bartoniae]